MRNFSAQPGTKEGEDLEILDMLIGKHEEENITFLFSGHPQDINVRREYLLTLRRCNSNNRR